MTVAELVAALLKLPQDAPVYVATSDRYYPDQQLRPDDVQVDPDGRVVLAKVGD